MAAFFLLLLLSISCLSSPSAFPIPAGIPQPFLEPPPLPLPEQNPELPASPVSSPRVLSPVAAAVGTPNQPAGQQQQQQPCGGLEQQPEVNPLLPASPGLAPAVSPVGSTNQQPSGGLEQDQQQQLDASVSGGNAQEQEPEQGGLQPTSAGAGVQPIEFGQGQQQQALGFGAQPLVDSTPYDSGSSRMGWSLFGHAYGLALLWLLCLG